MELLESMRKDGAIAMPCCGRCDQPVPVLHAQYMEVGSTYSNSVGKPSPVPEDNPGGFEECVFADIRASRRSSIEGYRASGGYEALERVVQQGSPARHAQ